MFHKEGQKIILTTFFLVVAALLATQYFIELTWLRITLQLFTLGVLVLILQFFRNPKRLVTPNFDEILAPVDGKVVVIEEVEETEYFKEKRKQVSIFMSPLNVHVTRYAASGTITFSKYHPGKYLVAWHPKSSTENERTTMVVETTTGIDILVRQIAGAMARRIKYYVNEGDSVTQGEEFGFIRFGSRVDLFLPLEASILVEVGQKTTAGETIIANL